MDWFLSPATAEAASALRAEAGEYLRRHAADPDRAWAAELTVGELVANAVDHTDGQIWVSLDWTGEEPVLTVHDMGNVFELELAKPAVASARGRGLWLVSQVARDLAVAAKRGTGKRVSVTLPVTRRSEESFDLPPRVTNPLPALEEAGPDGFELEPFLRALVVEMARTLEESQGPTGAERAVAQVGATVGGQMEREYRRARAIVGQMAPEQVADCYVRLKAAIGGDFYPIEITPERIVMGNRRCPFGEAVRHSPALCRMTSSVFGGIAARNSGGSGSEVLLEERIAVGDPECRVSVLLKSAGARRGIGAHRYGEGTGD